jgi:protein-serine/threonine kinase
MLRKGQEGHVRAEREVLKGASLVTTPNSAQWIVKMFYSFQDRDHLYLVGDKKKGIYGVALTRFFQILEYMAGGDLLNLLIERDVFEEGFTRFYAAEVRMSLSCSGIDSSYLEIDDPRNRSVSQTGIHS